MVSDVRGLGRSFLEEPEATEEALAPGSIISISPPAGSRAWLSKGWVAAGHGVPKAGSEVEALTAARGTVAAPPEVRGREPKPAGPQP
jgi:hypothetical protein